MRDFELSGRSAVHAVEALAATSQPLATSAAVAMLRAGGNAVDAAITAAAVLAVVQPSATGIGGDCFVLYAPGGSDRIVAYNGSGRAPMAAEPAWYLERGIRAIERHSPHSVTVPGAIDAWARMLEDHGTCGLDEVLRPAIAYARDGFPVHDRMAADWARNAEFLRSDPNSAAILLPEGRPPAAGALHRQPELARTLEAIARHGRDAFYTGSIAEDIVGHLRRLGGLHTMDDLASARGEYVEPIRVPYRGFDVYECPPNGQGIVALEMLNILVNAPVADTALSIERLHIMIEAAWIAFADRNAFLCDPEARPMPIERLLSPGYGRAMHATIRPERATRAGAAASDRLHSDTIYLCVVDRDGNAISLINSLYESFGSCLTTPISGVVLQNRGCNFVLDPASPNCIGPRKRPLHTIMPAMVCRKGKAVMPFGVVGGHYQPAGQVHVLTSIIDHGLGLQEAVDLPRIFPTQAADHRIEAERGIPEEAVARLRALGHNVVRAPFAIGGAQAIWVDHHSGVLTGASDPRWDGCALGY